MSCLDRPHRRIHKIFLCCSYRSRVSFVAHCDRVERVESRMMFRRLCMSLAVLLAAAAFFTPDASAQGEPTCRILFENPIVTDDQPDPVSTVVADTDTTTDSDEATAAPSCADAQAYPGPFTNMPVTPSSPYSAPVGLSAPVQSAPVTAAEPTGSGLAHSGSETFVLAYLGTGLLAFGAVALGIRRGSAPE